MIRAVFGALLTTVILASSLVSPATALDPVAEYTPPATLVVAPEAPVLTRTSDSFRFSVLVRSPQDETLAAGQLSISIGLTQFDPSVPAEADATASEEAADDETAQEPLLLWSEFLDDIEMSTEREIEIVITRDELAPLLSQPDGIYQIEAELVTDDAPTPTDPSVTGADPTLDAEPTPTTVITSTYFILGSVSTAAPIPLTLVVPLVLPSSVQGMPNRDDLVAMTPRLRTLLDEAERRNATLAVDPRIIASIRALGTAAPASSRELLSQLENTLSPVFLLQFADADPAVQAALGFDTLMQPLGLDYLTRFGTFEPAEDGSGDMSDDESDAAVDAVVNAAGGNTGETDESATETTGVASVDADAATDPETGPRTNADASIDTSTSTDPGADAEADADGVPADQHVPTLEQLVTLEPARPGAWPADGQVDAAALALTGAAGLTSLVLSSTNVSNATSSKVKLGEFDALIADATLATAAAHAISAESSIERAAGQANLAAHLALESHRGSTGLVLALDRGAMADTADPTEIFRLLDTFGWATIVSERQQPEGTATLRSAAGSESRRELLRAAMSRSAQIDELAVLLAQPDYLPQYQQVRLLQLFGTRYADPHVNFSDVDEAMQQRDNDLLRGVQPVTIESTQLVGASSRVPITLVNHLPFDAAVELHTVPTSAAISLPERDFEAVVTAGGNHAVLVPVQSRVSSGESGILLEVRDLADSRTFASQVQHLTLRTTVETIIMVVLGSATALLLGFGVWRSIKRRCADAQASTPAGLSETE